MGQATDQVFEKEKEDSHKLRIQVSNILKQNLLA